MARIKRQCSLMSGLNYNNIIYSNKIGLLKLKIPPFKG